MQEFRNTFYRLEAFLFQKPWIYGTGCFVVCWIISFLPLLKGQQMDNDWQKASFIFGPCNGLYAWFWKWRHRSDHK